MNAMPPSYNSWRWPSPPAATHDKYIGICGQAPSDYPEITRWLVEQGIESISLNADSVLHMTRLVLEVEAKLSHSN